MVKRENKKVNKQENNKTKRNRKGQKKKRAKNVNQSNKQKGGKKEWQNEYKMGGKKGRCLENYCATPLAGCRMLGKAAASCLATPLASVADKVDHIEGLNVQFIAQGLAFCQLFYKRSGKRLQHPLFPEQREQKSIPLRCK